MQEILELDERVVKAIRAGVSGHDIIHGELKILMHEIEQELEPLLENSNKLGSDEDYDDTVQRLTLTGYMDALVHLYQLTYALSFAMEDQND